MEERDLTERELETRINFSRPIAKNELEDLMRYCVTQIGEEEAGKISISLSLRKNIRYGTILEGKRYESIHDVIIKPGDIEAEGVIRGKCMKSASFRLNTEYDSLDRPVFTGLDFEITPGYEPGELDSDDIGLMQNMRKYTALYFRNTS